MIKLLNGLVESFILDIFATKTIISSIMKSLKTILFAASVVMLWSCGQRGSDNIEVWQKERNNIEEAEVVSIEDSLPEMHAHSYPVLVLGDTIIFRDSQSTDYIYAAYDVSKSQYIGSFGRFGVGPGEIANFGSEFLDRENRIMYGQNLSQWNISGFELDKAIGAPGYKAFVKVTATTDGSMIPSGNCEYVNDTTVICSARVPNKDWTEFEFKLGRMNLINGLIRYLPAPVLEKGGWYNVATSAKHDLIVATGLENDRVNLYDLEGNLKKSIYGKHYRPEIKRKRYYNCTPVITDDRIFFVYRRKLKWLYGDEIVELDHDGNYLRTLRTGVPIVRMVHHPESNRLYFGSVDEPQFGYVQL